MAVNPLAAFLSGMSEDQPPRTPVDEFMPPGMGLDEDDFYKLIESMSNNPALNFSTGMIGMSKGPFINLTPRKDIMPGGAAYIVDLLSQWRKTLSGGFVPPKGTPQTLSEVMHELDRSRIGQAGGSAMKPWLPSGKSLSDSILDILDDIDPSSLINRQN